MITSWGHTSIFHSNNLCKINTDLYLFCLNNKDNAIYTVKVCLYMLLSESAKHVWHACTFVHALFIVAAHVCTHVYICLCILCESECLFVFYLLVCLI